MATAMMDQELVPVSQMPATKAAIEKLCGLEAEQATVGEKLSKYLSVLQPTHSPQQSFSIEDRLEAREHLAATQVAHARLAQAVNVARTEEETARELDRVELHQREHALLRAEAPKLLAAARALEVAMERFRGIQVRAHEATGEYLDAIGPSGFLRSSGNGQRIGEVELLEDALRAHKLID